MDGDMEGQMQYIYEQPEEENHRENCIARACGNEFLAMGDSRKPSFGEMIRGIWASDDNPHRDGVYIKTVRRVSGRINPGVWYLLTDTKGHFWEYKSRDTVYLGRSWVQVEKD